MFSISSISASILLATLVVYLSRFFCGLKRSTGMPPLVVLTDQEMFSDSKKAYECSIKEYGPVVAVKRKDRLEYIVDNTLTAEVLTNDSAFSFERGTLKMLNLHPLLYLQRSFMQEIDHVVHEDIINRLDYSIMTIAPIFESRIKQMVQQSTNDPNGVSIDITSVVHHVMSESMLSLFLGKEYATEQNIKSIACIAENVATLTGIYENLGFWSRSFPSLMRLLTWVRVMLISIPYHLVFRIGLGVFSDLPKHKPDQLNPSGAAEVSVLEKISHRFIDQATGRISMKDRLWIMCIFLGLIFASVHQTAIVIVWVLFELAKRPEFLEGFRAEIIHEQDCDGNEHITYASLQQAEKLDSFIREVMRTKGDTLSTVRWTTRDVSLGGYIIPKDSFVIPLASLSHENEARYGETAKSFIGDRWVGLSKPAIMVSQDYFPFGLGRWACPGRALAVAEIKLMVMYMIMYSTPTLKGNAYTVVDPLNTTSVPPKGQLIIHPRDSLDHDL